MLNTLNRKPFAVIGHRGAAGLEPENTIRSIRRAIDIGVDIVEVDVRSTKDGHLILLHDEDFNRIAGIDVKARDISLQDAKNMRIKGEPIATLEEAIITIDSSVGLFIEIKEPEITESIIDLVKDYSAEKWSAIISFYDDALVRARKKSASIITGLIYFKPPGRVFDAKNLGAKIVLPRYPLATKKANAMAHKLGLYVVAWTVNKIEVARKLLEANVDGIASDYPDKLVQFRNQKN